MLNDYKSNNLQKIYRNLQQFVKTKYKICKNIQFVEKIQQKSTKKYKIV